MSKVGLDLTIYTTKKEIKKVTDGDSCKLSKTTNLIYLKPGGKT